MENMRLLFYRVYNFNQDIGRWNTSQVMDMQSMLNQASDFNQDISAWTGPAANSSQSDIFDYATNFNYKFA